MLYEKVYLYEDRKDVYFEAFCSVADGTGFEIEKRPAVMVIPGGAYAKCCSDREGEPIAKIFFGAGFNVFVLHYTTAGEKIGVNNKDGYPVPLLEASVAMSKIKQDAKKYSIDPEKIAVIGFSAGGHLAASLGTLWYKDFIYKQTGIEYGSNKPCAMILSYPVITMDKNFTNQWSADNIITGSCLENPEELFSIEKQVSENTVPAFIWHTASDAVVPVENSLDLAKALSKQKIPFELHIYPYGVHGLATCDEQTCTADHEYCDHAASWKKLALRWLKEIILK